MGKFMLYGVIILIIAFAANFFGFVSIPWLDVPFATEKSYYTHGTDRKNEAAKEILGEE
ncbi:MAG: hypothetical protein ACOC23_03870 [Thermodesulfobacteriota bacterium]